MRGVVRPSIRDALSKRVIGLLTTGIFERICYGLAVTYFAAFLQATYGLSLAELAIPLAIFALGSVAGTVLGGQIADRFRDRLMTFAVAMRIAQRLYEGVDIGGETVGLITYMRTDGVTLAPEAIGQTRRLIETKYGQSYVPEKPRVYTSKAKNAQEAHEAIRPTDLFRTPQDVAAYLDKDQLGLYELIWKRTVASQMESAVLDQVTVDIASADKTVQLRATGSVVKFNGFLTLYDEGHARSAPRRPVAHRGAPKDKRSRRRR